MTGTAFEGKVVFVTGAGSGIGRAVALGFAGKGASVAICGRRLEPLAETVGLMEELGGRGRSFPADVAKSEEVEGAIQSTVDAYGRVDIAVNSAGVLVPGLLADLDEQVWHDMLGINVIGMWLAMKHEIHQMRSQGGGVIVNLSSSIGTHIIRPRMGAYGATKAAIISMTRTAARECIADGIRINVVSPGPIDTPMSRRPGEGDAERNQRMAASLPLGRVGSVEEVASAVMWMASPGAGFAVGADLVIDGGASVG